jgi:hypothetical protein
MVRIASQVEVVVVKVVLEKVQYRYATAALFATPQ